MRISKLCLVVCAVTLWATSPTVRADDSPAQAAARAALEEQMRALDTQPASTNAVAPAATAPTTNVTNVPAAEPPPVAATPSGATMQPPTNPPAAAAPAQTTVRAAPSASSSGNSLFGPVPPPSGSIPTAAMLPESTPSATTSAAPTATPTPAPAALQSLPMEPSQNNNSTTTSARALGLQPIVAPPLPISTDQQAQLRALLEKYDAGTITPVQYQAQRAKILGQSH